MKTATKFTKKFIAVILCVVILCSTQMISAFAATEYTYGDFTYTVSSGNATITSYPETAKGEVEIPPSINGYPVTEIGSYSFYACTLVTSVTIPNTVKTIGAYAFAYCTTLNEVKIPSSVNSIGNNAFRNSNKVTIYAPEESYAYNYANDNDVSVKIYEEKTFSYNDTWSFANTTEAFIGDESSYYIPQKRYEEVFGKSYVDNVTISDTWGGNCFGMSATAALFYTEKLNWSNYDALYENDFLTVNSYYNSIRWEKPSWSLTKYYYTSSDYDTPVTSLIERYQIVQSSANNYCSGDNSTWDDLFGKYYNFSLGGVSGDLDYTYYDHVESGSYIKSIFDKITNSNDPLIICMQFQDGAHAILSRKDKKPMDMGNGWYRLYVYDPNYPLMPDGYVDGKTLRDYYSNDLYYAGEDRYIELNPSENKFRYKGFLNADYEATEYWGCDDTGKVLYCSNEYEIEGKTYFQEFPNLIYIVDSSCLPSSFSGTEPWLSSDGDTSIAVNSTQSFIVYDVEDKLIAVVDEGNCVVLDRNSASFYCNASGTDSTGKLEINTDNFKIECQKGIVECIGDDNVVSLNSETTLNAEIDGSLNSVTIATAKSADVSVRVSNIESAEKYAYARVSGEILSGEVVELAISEENVLKATTTAEDSTLTVSVKTENNEETEIDNLKESDGFDIRENIKFEKLTSVSVDDISMNYKDSLTITPTVEVEGDVDYTVTYESSDTSVAQVDENGKIYASGKGSATITCTVTDKYGNTVSDSCDVEVSYTWWQWIIVIVLFGWIWY